MHDTGSNATVAENVIRPTTFVESARLSDALEAEVTLASEAFQHTGSFKFRAAYTLASNVPNQHFIAASSGNFGQALAYACSLLGKSCTIVMPMNSARVKVDAVKTYGGMVDLIDTQQVSREKRLFELGVEFPESYVTNAYDDRLIIDGNATLGFEIIASGKTFDYVVAPIGGGGLSAGIVKAFRSTLTQVVGAEPQLANDAAESMRLGFIVANEEEPQTIADGARTISLGNLNWEILRYGLEEIIEVTEEGIKDSLRLLFGFANLKAEPTGALSLGAVLTKPDKFQGKSVCCVVSGGNVDVETYHRILAEKMS